MSETPALRSRSILLIVSLCLNIALVPIFALVIYRAAHRVPEIGAGGVLAPRTVMEAVPAERDRIQAIVDAHTPKIRALRAAALLARKEAFHALGRTDFSPELFNKTLADVSSADGALERENIAMMAESLAALTPAERQEMVERTKARNRSCFWRMFGRRAARG
jgi:predicted membrane metal-binding protein